MGVAPTALREQREAGRARPRLSRAAPAEGAARPPPPLLAGCFRPASAETAPAAAVPGAADGEANMRSPSEESVPLHEEFIYCCGAATHVLKCGPWKDLSKDESKNLPRLLFMIIPVFSRCPLPANEAFSAWILPAWLCSNIRGGSDPSPAACSGLSWPELWESCVLGYFASFDNLKKDLFLFMGCLRQEGRRNYLLKDLPVKKIQCFCVHCVQIMQLKCLKRQQQCILPA
ncbi:uncharacterized protein LOC114061399 isoform X3 [Empidonax traillii]|uniref:uncharacterized protein LOC114061399 isoform X3 n=1 Tax=Empidonax traillii TaxID=164674 RepID=UPI000FFDB1CD|nr:uncharacterized protein LOC114061399 isoform X3 [Empidonax traillii]